MSDDHGQGALVAGLDAVVDRAAGQVRRRQRGGGGDQQRDRHQDHLERGRGAAGRRSQRTLRAALVLAAQQPPDVAQHQQRAGEAPRLVGLVLGLVGDVDALRFGIGLGNGVRLVGSRLAAFGAHRRASSSRSSRSRCRKSTSSHPNSAISAYSGQRSSSSSWRAAIDDPPGLHHDDLVGERDRRQPVGDDERRPAVHRLAQPALDRLLGGRVDRRGGVVEDQDPRLGDQRPGDRDPLALAAGERQPALADDRVVAVGQAGDEVVGLGAARRELDLLPGRVRASRRRCSRRPRPRTGSGSSATKAIWRRSERHVDRAHVGAVDGTSPSLGSYRRASSATRLVLPDPVGPTSATVRPAATSSSISLSAGAAPS